MLLCDTFHYQKAAMSQPNVFTLFGFFMLEAEFPLCAEAQRGYSTIFPEFLLPVAMVCHTFITRMVQVKQAGIELLTGECLDTVFDHQ